MTITAFTVATERHVTLASYAADRMAWATGLDVNIRLCDQPHWDKYRCFDWFGADAVFYFDADIWALRKFNPAAYSQYLFAAAPDAPLPEVECAKAEYGLETYVNGGMFWASRSMRPVFDRIRNLYDPNDWTSRWHDQTPMNIEVQRVLKPVPLLPATWNTILNSARDHPIHTAHERHPNAVCLHYTAMLLHDRLEIFRNLNTLYDSTRPDDIP